MSAMDFDLHEYYAHDYRNPGPQGVMSTAGAIPEINEKGEVTMKKVKVQRYVSGKRPDYAQESSDEEDEPVFYNEPAPGMPGKIGEEVHTEPTEHLPVNENTVKDRRLERMRERTTAPSNRGRERAIIKPEIIGGDESESEQSDEAKHSSDSEEELDQDEVDRRRRMLLERAKERQQEEKDLLDVEDEEAGSEEDSSEYEEYSDSEDDIGPRLKPVFVRKADRITLQERDARQMMEDQKHEVDKVRKENRKKESHLLVEQIIKEEMTAEHLQNQAADSDDDGAAINTDDENEEEEYEAWKVRELKRIKNVREAREAREKEATELEKVRNMTEEERRLWQRMNPKQVTNKAEKGKYRFLQKYYHRGAFYLDNEDTTLKQDFSKPTLEDHFDKSILPKVMQVKNFGRSGRTKYTHLLDQDTTSADSPWSQTNQMNTKFHATAGGTKLQFSKPSTRKKDR